MSVIATAVKHLLAAGVTGDALVNAIAEMEASNPLKGFIGASKAQNIPSDLVGPALLELARLSVGETRRDDLRSRRGPFERWGYEGPITPRLPEKEWWPLRNAILRRDGGICRYCGNADEQMCADHVVPLSRGGSNEPENLVACCLPCNSSKADRLLSEWEGRRV